MDTQTTKQWLRKLAAAILAIVATDSFYSSSAAAEPQQAGAALTMMPLPVKVEQGSGVLAVGGAFEVEWSGCKSGMLERAMARFQSDVTKLSGIDLSRYRGPTMRIECRTEDAGLATVSAGEGYRLSITAQEMRLIAEGPVGVLRGLATVRQWVDTSSGSVTIPVLELNDAPRFTWRGLMIDSARHFISVAAIKRQIDAMELVKLNVLHLHLSDNEGFRVESIRYPKLTQIAAHGQYYSQNEIRDLLAYALDRGITIVPEFDVPAHVFAILTAYPNLASSPVDATNLAAPFLAALNPASDDTYVFVKGLLEEMTGLFPGRYFHIGGDEVRDAAWSGNVQIQHFMKEKGLASNVELEAYFHRQVREVLKAQGKTMIGWEEIAETSIPHDVVVQTWRSSNVTAKATAQGNPVIVSAGYYLDWFWPEESHYKIDPFDPSASGAISAESLAEQRNNPAQAQLFTEELVAKQLPPLTEMQQKLVLGGEAELWGELVTEEMLDGRLWPRAAAVAERFWSPAEVRDAADMHRRLIIVQDELRILGLEDDANRHRMVARFAAGQSGPIMTFLEVVAPVRNMAHMHVVRAVLQGKVPQPQELNSLADVASTDSQVAYQFGLDVNAYLGGGRGRAAGIVAKLTDWRDNEARFAKIAKGNTVLEQALPISADVGELARIGLNAMNTLQRARILSAADLAHAKAILDRQDKAEQASDDGLKGLLNQQPPADLLIIIAPTIRALVDAAGKER